ncbi:MAG TPA: hypothetical protein VGV39_15235 [Mesorhizobium sp.]|jgi:hypothetical protein|uniref:hypothetical protein n=1 Tax=Mesorhizobium sp. TaxID=1871066 RepID=UPI002DDC950D|nr:hypothetical protein [Mesorhizobium sp.]HEV2504431.1 hypothetical protein [Mesorhizobium sp.]
MHDVSFHRRSSNQLRPIMPEDGVEVHPRCREMADLMREGVTQFRALLGAGFTYEEISLHRDRAVTLATQESTRHVDERPDMLEDIIAKAREAITSRPPLPRGMRETQVTTILWGRYCVACAAHKLDPWPAQRERCLSILAQYLGHSELFDHSKRAVLLAVEEKMPGGTQ